MISDLLGGASNLVRGFGLIITRPRLFLLGGLPPLVTSIIFMTLLITLITNLDTLIPMATGFADGWLPVLHTAIEVAMGLAMVGGSVLIMVLLFSSITLLIGSPAYDKIAEFTESELGDPPGELDEPIVSSIKRSIGQAVVTVLASLIGSIVFALLGFIPVIGTIVVPVISTIFGGWLLTIELMSPAFERRGLTAIADRRMRMGSRRWRSIGFGVPTFLLLAVPFVSIVAFPAAAAGATILARDLLERDETVPITPR